MPPDRHLLLLGQYELVAAYVAVAVLLLSIAIWNRVRWQIRAAAVVVTAAFFFVSFDSVRNILGWPTSEDLPDRFEIIHARIQEPDETMRVEGAIYVWAMSLPGEGPLDERDIHTPGALDTRIQPDQMPRAYRVPYTRFAHEQVIEALIKLQQGVRQIGVTDRKPRKPGEHAPQSRYSFYDRPDPILPPKEPDPGAP